jgi:hypothetical protein
MECAVLWMYCFAFAALLDEKVGDEIGDCKESGLVKRLFGVIFR